MNNTYSTPDTEAAAYLLASGFQLIELSRNAGTVSFVFADDDRTALNAVLAYTSGASISARQFADAGRTLKRLVFNHNVNNTRNVR